MSAHLQLSLPSRDELVAKSSHLADKLARELGYPVSLRVTDNRSTMLSFRRTDGALCLRLHHMFLDASEEVLRALADYSGRGRTPAGVLLDDFIRGRESLIRPRERRERALEPLGRCFDLNAMLVRINRELFQGSIDARIGWGRRPQKRRRRSIRLGVYERLRREIRIHPSLDQPDVPAYFVEFIVFHEMLHQFFPSQSGSRRRRVHHSRAFREREKTFPFYEEALRWERQHLRALLRR